MSEDQAVTPAQEQVELASPVEQLLSGMDTGTQESSNELTPESVFEDTTPFNGFSRVNSEEPAVAEPQAVQTPESNEEVRYQYWQSEADKAKNEVAELKNRLDSIEQVQAPVAQQPQQEESEEHFPSPPEKPAQPRNFSREDAYSDPNSDSSVYLDSVDEWRDDMDEYNRLYTEYNMAILAEEKEAIEEQRRAISERDAQAQEYQSNMNNIANHLATNYNASQEEVSKFVEVMDKPESLTVDNLFQLFRMQSGGNAPQPAGQPIVDAQAITNKADSFAQLKRAQQVPSPMGVLPSSNAQSSASTEDGIFDSMVNTYNKRNPW
tara:strand:- start:1298 stop:2263 length:966 start_codon:yes stop_codon:yes gene_type:complete